MRGNVGLSRTRAGLGGALVAVALALGVVAPAGAAEYEPAGSFPAANPGSVAVDGQGNVFVTSLESSSPSLVRKYSASGKLLGQWDGGATPAGSGSSGFAPLDVAVDAQGDVYVADSAYEVEAIDKFSGDGRFLGSFPTVGDPFSVAVDAAGRIYSLESGTAVGIGVVVYAADGTPVDVWGGTGGGDGQFGDGPRGARGLATDRGAVFVSESNPNSRVQKFTTSGALLTKWGQGGFGSGQFADTRGLAIGPGGDVFVVDDIGKRIEQFTSEGRYLGEVSTPSLGVEDVAVGPDGVLYAGLGAGDDSRILTYRPRGAASGPAVRSSSLRYRRGRVKVRIACPDGDRCSGVLAITRGTSTLAKGPYRVSAGKRGTVTAKPTRKGRRVLGRSGSLRVKVVLRPRGGVRVSETLKLKR